MEQLKINFEQNVNAGRKIKLPALTGQEPFGAIMTNHKTGESIQIKKTDNSKIIASLRKSAESLNKQADKINTDVSGNWTYRRQKFADSANSKKDKLIKNAVALNRLADLWEVDKCPPILKGIRSANDFDAHYPAPLTDDIPVGEGYREVYPKELKKAEKMGLTCSEHNALFKEAIKELSVIHLTPEQEKQKKLDAALVEVRKMNIPGFFPTPDDVIERMLHLAYFAEKRGMMVLEPSAGIGNIADKIVEHDPTAILSLVERQHSLAEILTLKGYNSCSCADILEDPGLERDCQYDRILMNPPFEKGQDIEHVTHCFNNFLRPGGILVSVMSAGVMTNTTKKYQEFRELVAHNHGEFENNGQAFKDAFNSTGVNTVILKLIKS